jgi:alpha-1,2-mannosyltransferase
MHPALSILYTSIRISTANLSPIMDCDEVFNYWEPLHFVLFGS